MSVPDAPPLASVNVTMVENVLVPLGPTLVVRSVVTLVDAMAESDDGELVDELDPDVVDDGMGAVRDASRLWMWSGIEGFANTKDTLASSP